eukprot:6201807-Pyramimonas_sp.AAC.1
MDWHGQGAQKAEWRNKTLAIMTARLTDQINSHKTREIAQALHTPVSTQGWTKELELTFSLFRMVPNGTMS